jgi:hypothetical protein
LDAEYLADLLGVEPLLHGLVAVRATQGIDPLSEGLESCHHRLECAGFYIDYFHFDIVLFVFRKYM